MKALDPSTPAGARIAARLETELTGWLTTVNPDGQPQSSVIWFKWADGEIKVFSHKRAARNGNIEANPRVSFNLDTEDHGDAYVTIEAEARIDPDGGPASADPVFAVKYAGMIAQYGWEPGWYDTEYPVVLRITPTRWRVA
jgi:PPOX class probable F420-dependent enzyme